MRIPKRLQPLIDEGLVDEVIRPITSGKEAEVFVVRSQGVLRAAKVYKEATHRSFKNRADYLDGRKAKGSRGERAQARGGKFAKDQEEESWQMAEMLALNRLIAANVRVPQPRGFMDGVLLMDLVLALDGTPAPRLADCDFSPDEARALYGSILHEVQLMLCAGIVHGDLSEYNVLLSAYGPVVIDLPQMIDAAASRVARELLVRDVSNIRAFCARWAPELERTRFAEEMWSLWERALLTPDSELTGQWRDSTRTADVSRVRDAIVEAERFAKRPAPKRVSGGPGGGAPGGATGRQGQPPARRAAIDPRLSGIVPDESSWSEGPRSRPSHGPPQGDRGPRPPRPDGPPRGHEDRGPRPPHPGGSPQGDRGPRPPRPDGPPQGDRGPRPPRPHDDRGPRPPRPDGPPRGQDDRGPRPPRPDGPPRGHDDRGPRPQGPPQVGPRPPRPHDDRGPRPPRPDGPPQGDRGPRPPRPDGPPRGHDDRGPRPPRPDGSPRPDDDRGPRPPRPQAPPQDGPRPPRPPAPEDDRGPRPPRNRS